jgi:hypothetical protein
MCAYRCEIVSRTTDEAIPACWYVLLSLRLTQANHSPKCFLAPLLRTQKHSNQRDWTTETKVLVMEIRLRGMQRMEGDGCTDSSQKGAAAVEGPQVQYGDRTAAPAIRWTGLQKEPSLLRSSSNAAGCALETNAGAGPFPHTAKHSRGNNNGSRHSP